MKNCIVILNTCDAYSDLWGPFFHTFKKFFGEMDCKIIINTEKKDYVFDGFNIICHHYYGNKWGERLLKTLNDVDDEYVIMLYDDFILNDYVDYNDIIKFIDLMVKDKNISVIYLNPIIAKKEVSSKYPNLDIVNSKANYRLNSAPAIWRREDLIKYTEKNDTPWAWEFFGSARAYNDGKEFYSVKEPVYKYNSELGGAIHRGKWVKSVIGPVAKEFDLDIDFSKRGFEDETLKSFPHTVPWKIKFFITGFRMVGFKAFIFVWRSIKKHLFKIEEY